MAIYCHALCPLDRRDQLNGRGAFEQGGQLNGRDLLNLGSTIASVDKCLKGPRHGRRKCEMSRLRTQRKRGDGSEQGVFFRPKKVSSKAAGEEDEMLEVVGVMWSFFVGESPMAMEVVFDKEVDEEVWWC